MFDSVILFPIHFHMYIYIYIYIYIYAYIHVTHLFSIYFSSFQTMQRIAAAICRDMQGMVYSGYNLGTIRVVFALFTSSQAAKQLRPGPGLLEEQLSALRFLDLHGRPIGS